MPYHVKMILRINKILQRNRNFTKTGHQKTMYRFPASSRALGQRADWLLWRCTPAPSRRIPSVSSSRIAVSLPSMLCCCLRLLLPGASCRWRPLLNRTPGSRRSNPLSFHTAVLFGAAVTVKIFQFVYKISFIILILRKWSWIWNFV